ncbi:MAG: hypothetical protein ABIY55_31570, partial [Kofleriaceae bacterium]
SSVYRAAIDGNGELSPLVVDAQLSAQRGDMPSIAVGHELYVLGGHGAAGSLSTLDATTIAANGSLVRFNQSRSLIAAREAAGSARIGDFLYLIGGYSSTDGALASIERASLVAP